MLARVLERNERRDTGLQFLMSAVSRVSWFLDSSRSSLTLAVLKDAGIRPEVRERLMRVVRNGRMSLETAWKREEGIGAGCGVVRHN